MITHRVAWELDSDTPYESVDLNAVAAILGGHVDFIEVNAMLYSLIIYFIFELACGINLFYLHIYVIVICIVLFTRIDVTKITFSNCDMLKYE